MLLIVADAVKKADTKARIKSARQRVQSEIQDLTERLRITQENIKRLRQRTIDTNPLINTITPDVIKRELID